MRFPAIFIPHGGGPWPFVDVNFGPKEQWAPLGAYLRPLGGPPPAFSRHFPPARRRPVAVRGRELRAQGAMGAARGVPARARELAPRATARAARGLRALGD